MKKNGKITCLITSGGTKVPIDMVRSITNMSRGTFGSQIADAALEHFWEVTFLHAVGSVTPKHYWDTCSFAPFHPVTFVTFDDYQRELDKQLKKKPDIIILAAAVSDYGVENYVDGKIRSNGDLVIRLKPLPKLISTVRKKCPKSVLCGFKLLVNSHYYELVAACKASIETNKCDLVVGNDLRDIKSDNHTLTIVNKYGLEKKFAKNCLTGFKTLAECVIDECQHVYDTDKMLNKVGKK